MQNLTPLKLAAKIHTFTDLQAWRQAHELVLAVYAMTNKFPQSELYAMADQLRRAAVSVTSNIAEGFRRRTQKDKRKFYLDAFGSLSEVQSQMIVARDVAYISLDEYLTLEGKINYIERLLNGLIKSAVTWRGT